MAKELGIQTVELDELIESPFWVRQFKEDEEFVELVESVKKLGVIEPLVVRVVNGKLEIVAGHRRWLAARKAELKTIMVIAQKLSDEEAMNIQLSENIHRKDLSDFEKAMFLKKMIDKFGYTQDQLAKKIGKSQPFVSNHLRMLKLDENISREITEKQARTILTTPEPKREEVIEKVEETIKETGKPPTIKQIQNMTQIPECERCHTHSSTVKPEKVNGEDHNLCDKCSQHAKLHPEEVVSHFRFLERVKEGKVPEKLKPKPQETWQQRKAVMQPQKSKQEVDLLTELSTRGITPQTDIPIPLWITIPDGLYPEKKIAYYVHGEPHDKGKALNRDDEIKVALEKDGWTVFVFRHNEGNVKIWADTIQEALKW